MINPPAFAVFFSSEGFCRAARPARSYSSRAWERAEHYLPLQPRMRSHDNNLQSTKNFERIQKQKRQKKIKIILLLPRPHPQPVADIVPPRGDQGLLQHLSKGQWAQGPPMSPRAPRLHPIHPPTALRSLRPQSLTLWHPQGVSRAALDADTPHHISMPPEPCSRGVQDWGPLCPPGELPWLYGVQAGLCGIAAPTASEQNFLRSKGQDPACNPARPRAAGSQPGSECFSHRVSISTPKPCVPLSSSRPYRLQVRPGGGKLPGQAQDIKPPFLP